MTVLDAGSPRLIELFAANVLQVFSYGRSRPRSVSNVCLVNTQASVLVLPSVESWFRHAYLPASSDKVPVSGYRQHQLT